MPYQIIKELTDALGNRPCASVTGPLTPLLLLVPWTKRLDVPLTVVIISTGRTSIALFDEGYYHQIGRDRLADYVQGRVTLQELQTEYDNLALGIQNLYDKLIDIDLSSEKEDVLIAYLKEMILLFEVLADKTVFIETLNETMILDVIGHDKKDALTAIWEEATHPTFLSFDARRLSYLVDLIKKTDDISKLIRKVKFIYTDYHWTKGDDDIRNELQKIKDNLEDKEQEIVQATKKAEERKVQFDAWRKRLDDKDRFIVDYIQLTMRYRDIRKDPIGQVQAVFIEITSEFLKRAGIDPRYGAGLSSYEVVKGVEYLKKNKDEITKRADGLISVIHPDGTVKHELCNYNEALAEFYAATAKDEKVASIKGQIANKGFVKGVARIVLDPHDDRGFKDGDILVTSMTRPEFVPIMKRAGAVVTNEGGVTCHAAIVSRELGIPCVIGTKNATRLLKDGDMVEVDANSGIVTII